MHRHTRTDSSLIIRYKLLIAFGGESSSLCLRFWRGTLHGAPDVPKQLRDELSMFTGHRQEVSLLHVLKLHPLTCVAFDVFRGVRVYENQV